MAAQAEHPAVMANVRLPDQRMRTIDPKRKLPCYLITSALNQQADIQRRPCRCESYASTSPPEFADTNEVP